MLRNLLRPFSYLFIKHDLKWKVDWLYPLALAFLSTAVIFFFRAFGYVSLFEDDGLLDKILNFVSVLPGFYIAALAAIATFNKTDIDKTMPAPAPKLDIVIQGKNIAIELTRRRFLCSMFAFLTAESLILIVVAIFGQLLYFPAKAVIPDTSQAWVSAFSTFLFLALFWQMIVASFWGLYYLGDRLHQPDQVGSK